MFVVVQSCFEFSFAAAVTSFIVALLLFDYAVCDDL